MAGVVIGGGEEVIVMSQLVMGPVPGLRRPTVRWSSTESTVRPAASTESRVSVSPSPLLLSLSTARRPGRLARVRWSRVLSLILAAGLLVAVAVTVLGRAQADTAVDRGDGAVVVGSQAALGEHVVAPGDTLWALAQNVAPGVDPRETVDRIMRLNGLQGVDVQVGTVLLLPR